MKRIISAVLICVLLFTLISASAFAEDDVEQLTKTFSENEMVLWYFTEPHYGFVSSIEVTDGTLPAGLTCIRSLTMLSGVITGVPLESGTFTINVTVVMNYRTYKYSITLDIKEYSGGGGFNPFPLPTQAPEKLNITKHPTGEVVDEGGTAYFVSRCDGEPLIKWEVVAPTGETVYDAKSAPSHFPGLSVSGDDTDTLTLSGIPASLDGWAVQCVFTGKGEVTATSDKAVIRVNKAAPKAPGIMTQPVGGTYKIGDTVSIFVKGFTEGDSIKYQWYSGESDDVSSMQPIPGAVASSFTPPQTEGTRYYRVSLTALKNGKASESTYSSLISVTFEPAAVPTDAPASTPAPAPTQAPASTPTPTEAPAAESEAPSGNAGYTVLIIALCLAVLAVIAFMIMKKRINTK